MARSSHRRLPWIFIMLPLLLISLLLEGVMDFATSVTNRLHSSISVRSRWPERSSVG